jgi:hypothetical protein
VVGLDVGKSVGVAVVGFLVGSRVIGFRVGGGVLAKTAAMRPRQTRRNAIFVILPPDVSAVHYFEVCRSACLAASENSS